MSDTAIVLAVVLLGQRRVTAQCYQQSPPSPPSPSHLVVASSQTLKYRLHWPGQARQKSSLISDLQWPHLSLSAIPAEPCRQQTGDWRQHTVQGTRRTRDQPQTACVLTEVSEQYRMLERIKNKQEISLPVAGNLYFISHKISLTTFGCCFTAVQVYTGAS